MAQLPKLNPDLRIAIIGLGYVGLPVALAFDKQFSVVGFDIDDQKVQKLLKGTPYIEGVEPSDLANANIQYTADPDGLSECQVYIVTVPTPIDAFKAPDLSHLEAASKAIASILKQGDVVIFESTVYPGCTEEFCVPLLEQSGLEMNRDFFVGYSPERINVGDRVNTFEQIIKITSGSDEQTAEFVDKLYSAIIKAGTFRAGSIKVAEAAKAIENAQRDLNISFVNELALIFERIGIDTNEVLEAAATKWNFLNFKPGLVGGHCIGVDPYYLVHKAESLGYHPQVILSGRRINDNMGRFVAGKVIKMMGQNKLKIGGARVLILGVAFKENCSDTRNSRVIDMYKEFEEFGCSVEIFDPHVQQSGTQLPNIKLAEASGKYEAIVLSVAHSTFLETDWRNYLSQGGILFDVKSVLPRDQINARL